MATGHALGSGLLVLRPGLLSPRRSCRLVVPGVLFSFPNKVLFRFPRVLTGGSACEDSDGGGGHADDGHDVRGGHDDVRGLRDDGHDVGGHDVVFCADDTGGHDGAYYYDGGDDDDAVFFRSQVVSRRELARRRLGLRDAPEAAERQRQW